MPVHIRPSTDEFLASNATNGVVWGQLNVSDLGVQPAGAYWLHAMQRLSAVLAAGVASTTGAGRLLVNGVSASGEFEWDTIRTGASANAIGCLYSHPGGPMMVQSVSRVNNYNGKAMASSRLDVTRL